MLLAGICYFAFIGYRLLPDGTTGGEAVEAQKDYSGVPKWKQFVSLAVLVVVILAMIFEKQVGVNQTIDVLRFSGVVDPRFIRPGNTVASTQVADVRVGAAPKYGDGSVNGRPGVVLAVRVGQHRHDREVVLVEGAQRREHGHARSSKVSPAGRGGGCPRPRRRAPPRPG